MDLRSRQERGPEHAKDSRAASPALDPVFVLGMQRSGTSILAVALQELGFVGFSEGHLWQELVGTLERLYDLKHGRTTRRTGFALGDGRHEVLARHVVRAIDDFHRREIPVPPGRRWFDKSPSAYPIRCAPMLARLFPDAQFVFVHRDPRAVLSSGLRLWEDEGVSAAQLCQGWVESMAAWRRARGALQGRALEIAHARLVAAPEDVARELARFLAVPEGADRVGRLFRSRRQNSAYPERPPGDYRVRDELGRARRRLLVEACGDEMRRWGYRVPYDLRGDPLPAGTDLGDKRDVPPGGPLSTALRLAAAGRLRALALEARRYAAWRLRR